MTREPFAHALTDGSDEYAPTPEDSAHRTLDAALARTAEQPDAGEVEALARGWWEGAPNEGDWLRRDRKGREWSDAAREAYTDATRVLLSSQAFADWLAAHTAAAQAAAGERIAQAIEALPGRGLGGIYREDAAHIARTTAHPDALAGVIREARAAAWERCSREFALNALNSATHEAALRSLRDNPYRAARIEGGER